MGWVVGVGCEEGFFEEGEAWGGLGLEREVGRGRLTFHDASLLDREPDSFVFDLDVGFVGETDAAEEEIELARGASDSGEDGEVLVLVIVFVVHLEQIRLDWDSDVDEK